MPSFAGIGITGENVWTASIAAVVAAVVAADGDAVT